MRFLALLSLLFLPGNNILHGGLLAYSPHNRRATEAHHWWFSAWLAWGFVCSLSALNISTSILGSFVRMEGWLTWMLLARMAHVWWCMEDAMEALGYTVLASVVLMLGLSWVLHAPYLFPVATGGLLATAWPILLGMGIVPAMIASPMLLISGCRIAAIAVFLTSIPWMMKRRGIIVALGVVALAVAFSPLGRKFAHVNPSALGHGARADWLKQAWSLSLDRPIVGYGYDNILFVLKNPDVEYSPNMTPDRTHNFAADIVLQTGWVGFALWMAAMITAAMTVFNNPSERNKILLGAVAGWCIFGLLNPQGAPAHTLMLLCFWGISKQEL